MGKMLLDPYLQYHIVMILFNQSFLVNIPCGSPHKSYLYRNFDISNLILKKIEHHRTLQEWKFQSIPLPVLIAFRPVVFSLFILQCISLLSALCGILRRLLVAYQRTGRESLFPVLPGGVYI